MPSKFHSKAISRISPDQRALMVKSLEVIIQINTILQEKGINQKTLAGMLNISQAAVSKLLTPGGNFEINSIIRLEQLLGTNILITPIKAREIQNQENNIWLRPEEQNLNELLKEKDLEKKKNENINLMKIVYIAPELTYTNNLDVAAHN